MVHERSPALQVMHDEGGQDRLEACRRERERIGQITLVQRDRGPEALTSNGQQAPALIQAGHAGPALEEFRGVRTRAAASVQDALTGHIAQQGERRRPLVVRVRGVVLVVRAIPGSEGVVVVVPADVGASSAIRKRYPAMTATNARSPHGRALSSVVVTPAA